MFFGFPDSKNLTQRVAYTFCDADVSGPDKQCLFTNTDDLDLGSSILRQRRPKQAIDAGVGLGMANPSPCAVLAAGTYVHLHHSGWFGGIRVLRHVLCALFFAFKFARHAAGPSRYHSACNYGCKCMM